MKEKCGNGGILKVFFLLFCAHTTVSVNVLEIKLDKYIFIGNRIKMKKNIHIQNDRMIERENIEK